ncbi:MAG TPA: hypothetical protein VFR70_07955, partial [Flavobacterium sp.]|nr:hypothetical protein [Flavobacterium sp.]
IILAPVWISCYSQKKQNATFLFEDKTIEYSSYSFTNKNILDFYIICHDDAGKLKEIMNNVQTCLAGKNVNKKFYFLLFPEKVNNMEIRQKLFLELITNIVSRTKLIDSNLFVISDDDYSTLYRRTKKLNDNKYKHATLNDIKEMFTGNNLEICRMINN